MYRAIVNEIMDEVSTVDGCEEVLRMLHRCGKSKKLAKKIVDKIGQNAIDDENERSYNDHISQHRKGGTHDGSNYRSI